LGWVKKYRRERKGLRTNPAVIGIRKGAEDVGDSFKGTQASLIEHRQEVWQAE